MKATSLLKRIGWLAFALTASLSSNANAALLAYDPFAYGNDPTQGQYALGDEDAGTNGLGGQNPSIGPTAFYNGAWIQSGGDAQVVKALPSLAYPMFQPGIGGIQQETNQFACCTFGRTGREIAGGLGGGRSASTIYQSFLIDFGTQGTDDPTQFGKRGYEMWSDGIGDAFLAVDLFVNSFAGVNDLSLAVTTLGNGTTIVPLNGGGLDLSTLAGTHLVVMKFAFDPTNPDLVSVFLDPTNSNESDWTPAAFVSVASSDLLISHHGAFTEFTFSGLGHIPGAIDEIRWGDTFADVTPFGVPEPAGLSLFLLGILGVAFSRRRQ